MTVSKEMYVSCVFVSILAMISAYCGAGDFASQCPEDFEASRMHQFCQARDSAKELVVELDRQDKCIDGYRRILGIDNCIADGSIVDIVGGKILLSEKRSEQCPQSFQREGASSICTASDLLLEKTSAGVVRVSRRVAPLVDTSESGTLHIYSGPACPAGFVRPPGVRSCIAAGLVHDDRQANNAEGLFAPEGYCPEKWHRLRNNDFCVPVNQLPSGNIDQLTGQFDVCISCGGGKEGGWSHYLLDLDLTIERCPTGTLEVWWEAPVYDHDGVFIEVYIPTRYCLPETLEPEY